MALQEKALTARPDDLSLIHMLEEVTLETSGPIGLAPTGPAPYRTRPLQDPPPYRARPLTGFCSLTSGFLASPPSRSHQDGVC